MAADQSIALDVKVPSFDAATPLTNAQTILGNQTKLQILNRENSGQDIQFRSQLIRDAAAHALDADSWDKAMNAAAQRGAPEAAQYVGRYTPLLQQRLFDAYGGAAPQAQGAPASAGGAAAPSGAVGPPSDQLDRLYQNVPPEKMAASLQKLNMVNDALLTVRDPQSYAAAIQKLVAAGIPEAQQFAGAYSPLRVQQLYASIQPVRSYLQNRIASSATGVPSPLVKNETTNVGGTLYSVDPYKGSATALTPAETEVVPDAFWKDGTPVLKTKTGGIIPQGVVPGGVSVADAAKRITGIEKDPNNPAAVNPRSTAAGDGQFINSTWLDTVKAARPDLAKTLNDTQILALRNDPQFSADMTQALATQNAGTLTKAGLPVTTASLALAHRFGADGATKILNAAPNTPMEDIVSAAALKANPELKGQTAGVYAQNLMKQVGNDPVSTGDQGGGVVHKGQFDKPVLAEFDDGHGGTTRALAQQDNRTGQWVTADQKRTPIDATNMVILPESMAAGGGGRNAQMVTRQLVAARDATTEIKNIVELPLEASTGWFGGAQNAQPHSLLTATKNVLAQKVTDQEVQDFNTSMIGMGKALAALESGGMQTNQALIAQFDRLALLQGDTNLTKMRKLATMRQQAENALEANLTSPYMGKEQKEFSKKLLDDLRTAVPWTPSDVTKLQRSNNPSASLGDFAKAQGLGLAPADKQALDWANANPKDPRAAEIKQHLGVR